MHASRQLLRLLEAGGQMGRRIREMSWAATPVGDMASWSPIFCTALGTCLLSHAPAMLAWGAELTFFYNDAAIGLLGPKHPEQALGAAASAVWAEVWADVRPIYDEAMARGRAHLLRSTLFLLRGAVPQQEVYVDVDYMPVFGEAGVPLGVQVIAHDQTDAVVGQRRTSLVQALARHGFGIGAAPADARQAYMASLACLRAAPRDVPWAAIYLVERARGRLQLVGTSGAALALPAEAALHQNREGGRLLAAVRRVAADAQLQLVGDLDGPCLDLGGGLLARPPHSAAVLGLDLAGPLHLPRAVLAVAVSPYQPLDRPYLRFLHLVAGVIASEAAVAEALAQERRLAQQQVAALSREQQALQRLLETRDNFLALASHELKTPLTSLTLQTQMAVRRLRREPQPNQVALLKIFGHADAQLRRICRLVDDMLDLRRIDSGKLALVVQDCDLGVLAESVVERLAAQLEPRISLTVEPSPSPIVGQWDGFRIEQVLVNLLTNAARYGGGTPIAVRVGRQGREARVVVADSGPGVRAADRERIFGRFERAVSRNDAGGLGLGLFLVRQVVELHGGDVYVEDAQGGTGAAFVVSLPCS